MSSWLGYSFPSLNLVQELAIISFFMGTNEGTSVYCMQGEAPQGLHRVTMLPA